MSKRKTAAVIAGLTVLLIAAAILFLKSSKRYEAASYPRTYAELVEPIAETYGVDPALVYAVIRTESGFRPEAVSSIGARGLMQITEPTFEWAQSKLGADFKDDTYDDLFDPKTNITYGVYLLSAFLERFGTVNNALCAYHAGWGVTRQWLEDSSCAPDGKNIVTTPYADTNWYLHTVCEAKDRYEELYFEKETKS